MSDKSERKSKNVSYQDLANGGVVPEREGEEEQVIDNHAVKVKKGGPPKKEIPKKREAKKEVSEVKKSVPLPKETPVPILIPKVPKKISPTGPAPITSTKDATQKNLIYQKIKEQSFSVRLGDKDKEYLRINLGTSEEPQFFEQPMTSVGNNMYTIPLFATKPFAWFI